MDEPDRGDDIRQHIRDRLNSVTFPDGRKIDTASAVERLNDTLTTLSRRETENTRKQLERNDLSRRDFLKLLGFTGAGAIAAGGMLPYLKREIGTVDATGHAASDNVDLPSGIDVTRHADGYEVWTVPGNTYVFQPSGVTIENVLIDVTAPGAGVTFNMQGTGTTLRNVGYRGVNSGFCKDSSGQHIRLQGEGDLLVENVHIHGFRNNEMGGISALSGGGLQGTNNIVKNTYVSGMGNNAAYSESVDGELTYRDCFHWNNTVSQFRMNDGQDSCFVENCVAYVNSNAPATDGEMRPTYACGSDSRSARGVWSRGKNCSGGVTVRDSSFYIDTDDVQPNAALHARNQGECPISLEGDIQVDASRQTAGPVNGSIAGSTPTFDHLIEGVPLSPEMAARGERAIPDASDWPGMAGGPGTSPAGYGSESGSTSDTESDLC